MTGRPAAAAVTTQADCSTALRRLHQPSAAPALHPADKGAASPLPRSGAARSQPSQAVCTGGFRWPTGQREGRARGNGSFSAVSQPKRKQSSPEPLLSSAADVQGSSQGSTPLRFAFVSPPGQLDSTALLHRELKHVLAHPAPTHMCAALAEACATVLLGWARQVHVLLRQVAHPCRQWCSAAVD